MSKINQQSEKRKFYFSFPLIEGRKELGQTTCLGELIISGDCWQCEPGSPEGYGFEPYGFEIERVQFKAPGKIASNVTGLYEYLLSQTKDGAESFENATIQHVAGIFEQEAPFYSVVAVAGTYSSLKKTA